MLERYLDHLREQGRSPAYIDKQRRVLTRLLPDFTDRRSGDFKGAVGPEPQADATGLLLKEIAADRRAIDQLEYVGGNNDEAEVFGLAGRGGSVPSTKRFRP